jgi:predicted AAA+ superfamily ATPase
MKRDLYIKLGLWKLSQRRKPLILQGARQVGKTYALKYFGQQEFASYVYLNFESDVNLKSFFESSLNPRSLIEKISIYTEQTIVAGQTLLIFDEIQECPAALNSLKYFYEDASEYHVVAAGSLLGVKLTNTKGFPVGKVDFLTLYPLSFFEFLDAIGRQSLRIYLEQISTITLIDEIFHQELLFLLKKYMFIGGMPEVVAEYIDSKDLLSVRTLQENILRAYELDFIKHAPKDQIIKITEVWNSIPRQLAKENKKFVFSAIKENARGREYEDAIGWLVDAGLVVKSFNLSVPKVPLPAYGDNNAFKIFLLDVGLLAAMAKLPVNKVVAIEGLFNEFYGAFTENFVAQELRLIKQSLYYWTSNATAEVDFIIESDLKLYPLEVKANASLKKKSLLVYKDKYNPELLLRASAMNLKQDGMICNFPLYLVSRLLILLENNIFA